MRLNFSELDIVAVKQIREDKDLKTIYTLTDTDGGSWYMNSCLLGIIFDYFLKRGVVGVWV